MIKTTTIDSPRKKKSDDTQSWTPAGILANREKENLQWGRGHFWLVQHFGSLTELRTACDILTWTWDSTSCCWFNNCYRKRKGEGKEDIYILLT